MVETIDCNL